MVIPTQPPLTATKKSTPKPQAPPSAAPASSPSPSSRPQQPVPASYSTASTPSQPTFSVQARAAQPGPQQQQQQQQPGRATYAQGQYTPAQPRGPDFAYGPPQPTFSPAGGYHEQHYVGAPAPGGQNTWRPEPSHHSILPHNQSYQPPTPKKTYITDSPASMAPYGAGAMGVQKVGMICSYYSYFWTNYKINYKNVLVSHHWDLTMCAMCLKVKPVISKKRFNIRNKQGPLIFLKNILKSHIIDDTYQILLHRDTYSSSIHTHICMVLNRPSSLL